MSIYKKPQQSLSQESEENLFINGDRQFRRIASHKSQNNLGLKKQLKPQSRPRREEDMENYFLQMDGYRGSDRSIELPYRDNTGATK